MEWALNPSSLTQSPPHEDMRGRCPHKYRTWQLSSQPHARRQSPSPGRGGAGRLRGEGALVQQPEHTALLLVHEDWLQPCPQGSSWLDRSHLSRSELDCIHGFKYQVIHSPFHSGLPVLTTIYIMHT